MIRFQSTIWTILLFAIVALSVPVSRDTNIGSLPDYPSIPINADALLVRAEAGHGGTQIVSEPLPGSDQSSPAEEEEEHGTTDDVEAGAKGGESGLEGGHGNDSNPSSGEQHNAGTEGGGAGEAGEGHEAIDPYKEDPQYDGKLLANHSVLL